nr:hypothetical protein [Tanacetum cinerariifolium]
MLLDFEQPIAALEGKLHEMQKLAADSDVDVTDAVVALEAKINSLKKETYANLTRWQRQKGHNTKQRQFRNFGMPNPEGYRKALRLMKLAEKFGKPIITLIDTPGAFPGLEAEERGQGEAIARNLKEMFMLKVPVICVIIGEGASGGALEQAAEALKLTATDMKQAGLVDGIIEEPLGGAHTNAQAMIEKLKQTLVKTLDELAAIPADERISQRIDKFSAMGVVVE